jgi:hypothetical protein
MMRIYRIVYMRFNSHQMICIQLAKYKKLHKAEPHVFHVGFPFRDNYVHETDRTRLNCCAVNTFTKLLYFSMGSITILYHTVFCNSSKTKGKYLPNSKDATWFHLNHSALDNLLFFYSIPLLRSLQLQSQYISS